MSEPAFVASSDYYSAIEEAILETPRGRWFLREHAKRQQSDGTARILAAIESLRTGLTTEIGNRHVDILRRELQEMSHSIVQTRQEIAAIKPVDPGNNRIMAATEELDAIVTATERATGDILTAAERLHSIVGDLASSGAEARLCDEVGNLATTILMACSFQDITGQRTTKVVHVLRYLEQRVNAMIEIWGVDGAMASAAPPLDTRPDAHLLSGPAREGEGISQDTVDSLFSGVAPAPAPAAAPAAKTPAPRARPAAPAAEPPTTAGGAIDQGAIDELFA